MICGKNDAKAPALCLNSVVSVSSMGVWSFKYGGNAQIGGNLDRFKRSIGPGMHYVNLPCHSFQTACDDMIMQCKGAHCTQGLIGNSQFAPRERGTDRDALGEASLKDAGEYSNFCTRRGESIHLLPRRVTDTSGTEFVRKAVKNTNWIFIRIHRLSLTST